MIMEPNYYKKNLAILADVFKNYREQKGYSIRGISRSINLAYSTISDIENGKVLPNIETLQLLFKAISVSFHTNEEYLSNMFQTMESLWNSIYYDDVQKAKENYDVLSNHQHELMHSLLYVEFQLATKAYEIIILKKDKLNDLDELSKYHKHYTDYQCHLFKLLYAVNHLQNNQVTKALTLLEEDRHMVDDEKTDALMLYYLTLAYHHMYKNHETMIIASKAAEFFIQHHNTNRKINLDLIKLSSLIDLANFGEAEKVIKSLDNTLDWVDGKTKLKDNLLALKAYYYYRHKKYQEAMVTLDDLKEEQVNHVFLRAVISFRNKNLEDTKKWLDKTTEFSTTKKNNHYKHLTNLFLYFIGHEVTDEKLRLAVEETQRFPYRFESVNLSYLAHDLVVYYYMQRKEYEIAITISNRWLDVVKDRDYYETIKPN